MRALFLFLLVFSFNLFAVELPDDAGEKFRKFLFEFTQSSNVVNAMEYSNFQKAKINQILDEIPDLLEKIDNGQSLSFLNQDPRVQGLLSDLEYQGDFDQLIKETVEKRNQKMRTVLANNPEIFYWLSDENNVDELFNRSRLDGISKEIAGNNNFKNKIIAQLDEASETLLNSIKNPAISNVIGSNINAQDVIKFYEDGNLTPIFEVFQKMDVEQRKKVISVIPDNSFNNLSGNINSSISKLDISSSKSVESLKQAELNIPNKDMKELAEVLLESYFDKDMPNSTKRNILEAVLALHPEDHFSKLEVSVLKNTDILFQKSMQFFSTKSENPKLKRIGLELKSNLPFIEQDDIDYILKKSFGDQVGELKNMKQVAAATTGVGILADYRGEKVFIKVQRPGIQESLSKDLNRILDLVGDKVEAQSIVKSIGSGVAEELNLKQEAFNYEVAKIIYEDPKKGMAIPGIIKDFKATDRAMVMEVADGIDVAKIDITKLSDDDFIKLGQSYEQQLKIWFERSMHMDLIPKEEKIALQGEISKIYKSYFGKEASESELDNLMRIFNGDLHGGNVFFEVDANSPTGFKTTWIDWGNVHHLDQFQARGQIELMLGAINRNPNAIADAMEKVMDVTPEQRLLYLNNLYDLMERATKENMPIDIIMNQSVSAALQSGIEPPESIVNWGRGKGMLQFKLEDDIIKELNENRAHLIGKKINGKTFKGFKSGKIYLEVVAKNVKSNLPKQLVSQAARDEAILTSKALMKFIKNQGVYLLQKYCGLDLMRRRPKLPIEATGF